MRSIMDRVLCLLLLFNTSYGPFFIVLIWMERSVAGPSWGRFRCQLQVILHTCPPSHAHSHSTANLPGQVYKVETAGDCYIVAGGLMHKDKDGFLSLDKGLDAGGKGAEKVMAFAKVGTAPPPVLCEDTSLPA